jgi:hypothetical protein
MAKKRKVIDLGWKLKGGSHVFPGPDGGTCINEAAIIARGFEYRQVNGPQDFPPCFSRVIGLYALELNDQIEDVNMRTELLMPFVVRLAGTKDKPSVELKRAKFLAIERERRYLVELMKHQNTPEEVFSDYTSPGEYIDANSNNESTIEDIEELVTSWKKEYGKLKMPDFANMTWDQFRKLSPGDYEWEIGSHISEIKRILSLKNGPLEIIKNIDFDEDPESAVKDLDAAIKMGKEQPIADWKAIKKRLDDYKKRARPEV